MDLKNLKIRYQLKHFTDCIESHAPTSRLKLTHPIAPWMKKLTIVSDHQKLELSRIELCDSKKHQK